MINYKIKYYSAILLNLAGAQFTQFYVNVQTFVKTGKFLGIVSKVRSHRQLKQYLKSVREDELTAKNHFGIDPEWGWCVFLHNAITVIVQN